MILQKRNKKLYAYLQKNIYEELNKAYNRVVTTKYKLDWRMLVIFMSNAINVRFRDKNYPDGKQVFTLNSEVLKDIASDYPKYMKFLHEEGFLLLKKKGNTEIGSSKYEIPKKYFEEELYDFVEFEFNYGDSVQISNNINFQNRRSVEAEYLNPELSKWLSDESHRFTFNEEEAKEFVNKNYKKKNSKKNGKWNSRMITIRQAVKKVFRYTRDGKDNRFHSLFTNTAKEMRKFFRFDDKRIKGKDISSSHPVLFSWLLEGVLREILNKIAEKNESAPYLTYSLDNLLNEDYINGIKETYKNYKTDINVDIKKNISKNLKKIRKDVKDIVYSIIITLQNSFESIDFTEIYHFIKLVRTGEFYEEFATDLLKEGIITYDVTKGKYLIYIFSKKYNCWLYEECKTPRDAAKLVSMNLLYSANNGRANDAVKYFRNKYPSVELFLNAFRCNATSINDKGNKDFATLVQNLEANLVIDHCAKKIAKKYPEMLLISIHDSLNTTEDNFEILEQEFQQLIDEKLGFQVRLGTEEWYDAA